MDLVTHRARSEGAIGRAARHAVLAGPLAVLLALLPGIPRALAQNCGAGEPTIAFSVRVTDADREVTIGQVRLDLVRFPDELVDSQFTDAKGDAQFECIIPNGYLLRASKDGYNNTEVTADLRRNENNRQIQVQMRPLTAEHSPAKGDVVSARALAIPAGARKEFETGIRFLNRKKDPKRGLDHFQKAIAAYPDYYEAYFLAGMAYLQLQSPAEARAALEKAIELDPKFIEPYYPLATLLIGQKKYADAERRLLAAAQLDPQAWQYPFEMARSKADRGQWAEALNYARRARALPNASPKIRLLVSDIYSNTGRVAEAIRELEAFEKEDPQSPYMPRVREVLSQLRRQ